MKRPLGLAICLALLGGSGSAQEASTLGPLQFQEVVTVKGATRDQIYAAALAWFSDAFQGAKDELVQNKLAGTLIGTGFERCKPLFFDSICGGSIRYRVFVAARDGRYYYSIDGFKHELDIRCRKKGVSFELLTTDWLNARVSPAVFDLTLRPPTRHGEDMEAWAEVKREATTLAENLARSLRAKLATASTGRPW